MRNVDTGRYLYRIESAPPFIFRIVDQTYGDASRKTCDKPADFRIRLSYDALLRRFLRPQLTFYAGNSRPFKPIARNQAYPTLEWGMNWCVAAHEYTKLILHAAVLVRDGRALVFPADPGSGKSTLASYFALNGWQLFSDEMAVIEPSTNQVTPLFRPICLKNKSITLVKAWAGNKVFTPSFKDTAKGEVAHFQPRDTSEFESYNPAKIVGIVFPQYVPDSDFKYEEIEDIDAFEALTTHSFNYHVLGSNGFKALSELVKQTQSISIAYSQLEVAESFVTQRFFS